MLSLVGTILVVFISLKGNSLYCIDNDEGLPPYDEQMGRISRQYRMYYRLLRETRNARLKLQVDSESEIAILKERVRNLKLIEIERVDPYNWELCVLCILVLLTLVLFFLFLSYIVYKKKKEKKRRISSR
jgi:hypothetical protein